jgi:flagellin
MLSQSNASGTAADVKVVSAFNRTAAGAASISTIDIKVEDIKLYDGGAAPTKKGILDLKRDATGAADTAGTSVADMAISSSSTDADITGNIQRVENALKEMTTAATKLGSAKTSIDLQKTFTASLMDSIDRGVGQLVDADMNKESTRLQALQTQQQLGIQALSIANGNTSSILSLFRG